MPKSSKNATNVIGVCAGCESLKLKNEKLCDLFHSVGTYNKFVVIKILSDGVPRTKLEMISEFNQVSKTKVIRNTILRSLESLEIADLIVYDPDEGYYHLPFGVNLTPIGTKIVRALKDEGMAVFTLKEVSDSDEALFELCCKSLERDGVIEQYEKQLIGGSLPAYRLKI